MRQGGIVPVARRVTTGRPDDYHRDMLELPIDPHLPAIAAELRRQQSLVIVAAPGAGKSTRVPPAILDAVEGAIVMLQPRRVAARAVAARIASECHWELGREVGYHVRFEKRYTRQTRIRVMTEGILTRMLVDDPYLDGVGCVILDEFHERNLNTDLAIAFLREVQQTVRPELKLLAMSATLDAAPVATFLAAQVIDVPGRTFPIDIVYRPAGDAKLEEHVARAVEEALDLPDAGDALVFLPGVGEIERARRAIPENNDRAVLPLHGSLTPEQQQRALAPDPRGRRRIILATNIAETSLTIDGVRTVVDSGLVRVASFDADRGMDRLDLERISQASATQRAGRAGRQAPGRAFRLWPERDHKHLAEFNIPEIQRVDLASSVLAVHAWGAADARAFGWFEKPPEDRLAAAEELLELLGALERGKLTDAGRAMVGMPVHPRVARMLMAAAGNARLLDDAVDIAAILGDDSRRGWGNIEAMVGHVPAHLQRARDQLMNVARSISATSTAATLGEVLLAGFADRVVRRRVNDPRAGVMVGGMGVRVDEQAFTPALAASELFLALDAHRDPRNRRAEALVRTWAVIDESSLEKFFPHRVRTETAFEYDPARAKIVAATRRVFADLVLHEDPHGEVNRDRAGKLLADALAPRARELFLQDEASARFLARMALAQKHVPEKPWPAFDDGELRAALVEACAGKRSLAELTESRRLEESLRSRLQYPLDRDLDTLAPETLQVPSGSRIRLDYAVPSESADLPAPILAVRLQELFGWTQTPRVCAGRVPVVLHLLSPGFKPMQITSDLASFWRSAYFEVRKDLRVRYPKHKWPEDPLSAQPEAKGRPRR